MTQIHWLSKSLIGTDVLNDADYLCFLQSLVNFGAFHGQHDVTQFINHDTICQATIPKRCDEVQTELKDLLKDTEFSVSYHRWSNKDNEHYVTVFGYFFTPQFEYWNNILGTRPCDVDDDNVASVIREISDEYWMVKEGRAIKCVGGGGDGDNLGSEDFESFPCIIGQISKVIVTAMHSSPESETYFKKLHQMAHETLNIPLKTFEATSDDYKVKTYYELYQYLKLNGGASEAIIDSSTQLLGQLFSAVSSLTKLTDTGKRSITANEIYLWSKKFLKFYSNMKSSDDVVMGIKSSILKAIKTTFTDRIQELYQVAVFLDPNFKNLKFLDASERYVLLEIVRKNLHNIINQENGSQPPTKKQKLAKNTSTKSHLSDTFLEFMDISMESLDDQVNSEIQCYMGFKLEDPVNILDFWRENECFPYLKKLARNLLNLPSCTFHSNCCFLSAGNEFYKKCESLSSEDVETLTFLHQNFI